MDKNCKHKRLIQSKFVFRQNQTWLRQNGHKTTHTLSQTPGGSGTSILMQGVKRNLHHLLRISTALATQKNSEVSLCRVRNYQLFGINLNGIL